MSIFTLEIFLEENRHILRNNGSLIIKLPRLIIASISADTYLYGNTKLKTYGSFIVGT